MVKVLVTGGAGFIGSHLCRRLSQRGDSITVVDNLSTGRAESLAGLNVDMVVSAVESYDRLEELVRDADFVFHLAAAVGCNLVVEEPVRTILTNVVATEKVLALSNIYRKPTVITSTSEVYGRSEKPKFSETDDCVIGDSHLRRWGYAASKLLDEFLAMAYFHENRAPVAVVRLFNTVGPGQTGRYGMVVPRFARWALKGDTILVYGTGDQRRCFTHVEDVVDGLTAMMGVPFDRVAGKIVNLGSENEVSIKDLAHVMIEKAGSKSKIKFISYKEAYGEEFQDVERRYPKLDVAKELLLYEPKRSLKQVVEDVIEYERARL